MSKSDTPTLAVNEYQCAQATGLSIHFVRKDRIGRKLLPFYRVGGRILYNLDRVRETLKSLEEGGVHRRGGATA